MRLARHLGVALVLGLSLVFGGVSSAAGTAAAASRSSLLGLGVSPQPDTPDASPMTQISLLGLPVSGLGQLSVTGSRSGLHAGRLRSYAASTGASFLPYRGFTAGETVTVRLRRAGFLPAAYQFRIARAGRLTLPGELPPLPAPVAPLSFVSRPDLRSAPVTVTTNRAGSAPGYVFIAPDRRPEQPDLPVGVPGPLIVDNQGSPVWFHPLSGGLAAYNFRPQTYQGQSVLTWWEGRVLSLGYGVGEDVIADHSYREIGRVRAGNGYRADLHEFVITPENTALMTMYNPVLEDVSSIGGPHSATVMDSIVQEVDIKTGLVMFEWHALGHVSLSESYATRNAAFPFDYFHVNSVQLLPNHNLLLSARNTWAAYQVSRSSGAVLWRLGGKRSTFKLGPGARFAWQHDALQRPDGAISIFDDEAVPAEASQTRGLVLYLDRRARTATVDRQYTHQPSLLSGSQGNIQALSNGDVFAGWGAEPYFSEFSRDGQVLFDAHLPPSNDTYRAFRAPWAGHPSGLPDLAVRAAGSQVNLYASWNGATEVASWQVLAGSGPPDLGSVASAPRTGFETMIPLTTEASSFAVRAMSASGKVLATSRIIGR